MKSTKLTAKTATGGTMTFIPNERGLGGRIEVTKGYRETPEERRARLTSGPKANTFTPRPKKAKGGRQGAKRRALADY